MSFPFNKKLSIQESGSDFIVAENLSIDVSTIDNIGYEIVRGAAAGFTANLEGSVGGNVWTTITAIDSTKQGALGDHYNFVRVNVTVLGASDSSQVWIGGRLV